MVTLEIHKFMLVAELMPNPVLCMADYGYSILYIAYIRISKQLLSVNNNILSNLYIIRNQSIMTTVNSSENEI